jgi:hypothetical protein
VQPRESTSPVSPVTSSVAPKKATAPIQLPSAPLPPPAPKASTSPVRLPPPVMPAPSAPPPPAATVPMAPPPPPGAAPRPPVAPSAPIAPRPPSAPSAPSAPRMESGAATAPLAKTVPLKPVSAAPRTPGTGTGPMVAAPGGAPTAGLPKATVKLQQTQPMSRPSISAEAHGLGRFRAVLQRRKRSRGRFGAAFRGLLAAFSSAPGHPDVWQ